MKGFVFAFYRHSPITVAPLEHETFDAGSLRFYVEDGRCKIGRQRHLKALLALQIRFPRKARIEAQRIRQHVIVRRKKRTKDNFAVARFKRGSRTRSQSLAVFIEPFDRPIIAAVRERFCGVFQFVIIDVGRTLQNGIVHRFGFCNAHEVFFYFAYALPRKGYAFTFGRIGDFSGRKLFYGRKGFLFFDVKNRYGSRLAARFVFRRINRR